jgi:7-cyano-7-deazaguanine synthase
MKPKAMVVLSGGQDSTTCLFWALHQDYDVHAVTFGYGQKHSAELVSAHKVATMAGIPESKHELVFLGHVLKGSSPLVNPDSKLEQYADHNSLPGGLEKTFVPMRNQLFLTVAANRAFCIGASTLVTGVCQEDYGGYPDCRQDFITAMEDACELGTFTPEAGFPNGMAIQTPLMKMSKAMSIALALELPGCYEALAYSHTSYDGQYPPTGKDHATLLRAKGFIEANVPDPLILRAIKDGLMETPVTPNYSASLIEEYMPRIR